jgi:flavin-binding protein dodecin
MAHRRHPDGANCADPPGEPETWLGAKHNSHPQHLWEIEMPEPTYKVVEIVGTSEVSISKAIEGAITKASGSLRHLGWFEVGQIRGNIADGKVNRYQVTLKVGFTLE